MRYFFNIIFVLFSCFVFSQEPISFKKENYFDSLRFEKMKEIQKHLSDVEIFKLSYLSVDNLKISGFLIIPRNIKQKNPLVIMNRGGNGNY